MRGFTAFAALSALSTVSALNGTAFTIDPTEVTLTLRASWCKAQENTCTILCDSNPDSNSCDDTTLDFSCTCQNGTEPGLQYYTQTVDTFVCEQAYSDCIQQNENSQSGQSNCTNTIKDNCGTLDPTDYSGSASTSSSASASGTASATASGTAASGTASASATSSTAAAAAATNIHQLGTGAVAAAFGVLAYML